MKFPADMNVSMSIGQRLRNEGHDAIHVREQKLQRLSDAAIIGKAKEEGRVILTFDLDFGDLMAAGGDTLPSVIIFRLYDERPALVSVKVLEVIGVKRMGPGTRCHCYCRGYTLPYAPVASTKRGGMRNVWPILALAIQ